MIEKFALGYVKFSSSGSLFFKYILEEYIALGYVRSFLQAVRYFLSILEEHTVKNESETLLGLLSSSNYAISHKKKNTHLVLFMTLFCEM